MGNQAYTTAGWSFGVYFFPCYLFRENSKIHWKTLINGYVKISQVTCAKTLPANKSLQLCDLTVSLEGVFIETNVPTNQTKKWSYSIDTISYGVQDLVYTRVFAMIVVKDNYNIKDPNPFEVHAFVCDSRYVFFFCFLFLV